MESVSRNESLSAGAPARLICSRCGAFSDSVERVLTSSLCPGCAARQRERQQGIKLYPSGYLWAIGILVNGTVAAVLSALNWSRVGQPKRAQTAWILAGVCLAVSVVVISAGSGMFVVTVASLVTLRTVLDGWKPLYEEHRRIGGRRASLVLPVVVLMGVLVAGSVAFALVMPDATLE